SPPAARTGATDVNAAAAKPSESSKAAVRPRGLGIVRIWAIGWDMNRVPLGGNVVIGLCQAPYRRAGAKPMARSVWYPWVTGGADRQGPSGGQTSDVKPCRL
ncbi:MAG: hypothetical protein ABJC24_06530, partial [Chloroflexota bacterium]